MTPDKFVGIQIWAIGRQRMELQATFQTSQVLLDKLGLMNGKPVQDQEDCPHLAFHKILQKLHQRFGIELAIAGRRPKLPTRIDRADDIDALPLPGSFDHRCLALQSISAPQDWVRLKPRFVQKENLGTEFLGPSLKLRITLL